MIPVEAILDAFIDANILLVVAFTLWSLARLALRCAGFRRAPTTELKLLNSVFLAVAVSPFLVLGLHLLQGWGISSGVRLNLSDMVVSHYLNGGFEMKASEFERFLRMRDTFTLSVVHAAGWVAWIAITLFLTGCLVGLLRLALSIICLVRIVSGSYAWRRSGRVRIRLSDRILVPFTTRGLRNFHVVIPSHMLGSKDELRVSLAHEFQHIRQGDIAWEILLEALKPVFFMNPAFHAWKRQVETLRELSCDAEVLDRGRVDAQAYCNTLLSVCQRTLRRDRAFVVAMPKVTLVTADRSSPRPGKMSFLEHRIVALLDMHRPRHPKLVHAAMVLPLATAILLTAIAIQRPADWSQDRLMLSTVVNLERLEEINRYSAFGRIRD